MSGLVDYLVNRPINAFINGMLIGMLLPITLAGRFAENAGFVWAWVLAPLWFGMFFVTIPGSIVYCLVMVMTKGPLWQYPPHLRNQPVDWKSRANHSGPRA